MRTIRILAVFGLALFSLGTRASPAAGYGFPPVERARYLMGTRCEIRAFGPEARVGPALDAALDRIAEIESVLTTWRDDGELARLNASQSVAPTLPRGISPVLADALRQALDLARRTGGRFDPTAGALVRAWDLHGPGRVPSGDELRGALSRTGWTAVELDAERATVRYGIPGIEIELGGFGKGFALDEAAAVLRTRGIEAALINFGGQVLALGSPPGAPAWLVDVADPADRNAALATLAVRDASVSTSGNSERSRIVGDRRIGHLLDPRTGWPSSWSGSVTVVAAGAAEADALSTALAVDAPRIDAGAHREIAYLTLGAGGPTASPALRQYLISSPGFDEPDVRRPTGREESVP